MNLREWIERNYGARPSKLTQAALAARVRQLQGMLTAARKLCIAVERWDAVAEAVTRLRRGQDRPGDT